MDLTDATVGVSVGPFEGFGTFVVDFDMASDFAGEIDFGSKNAAGDQIALNFGEPDFDLIEPGRSKLVCSGAEGWDGRRGTPARL